MDNKSTITVITPTTGRNSLKNLMETIISQNINIRINHLILWDNFRNGEIDPKHNLFVGMSPNYKPTNIVIDDNFVNGEAKGSSLRAVGLMLANTEYVTFSDDDVMWEKNHISTMLEAIKDKNWCYCRRKIWTELEDNSYEYLGVDEFESVGEEAKTPYKMVDNNCMMFKRRYGVSASPLYRETLEYNDDRLFYNFMKQYAGEAGKTTLPTINQVCPSKLVDFFRAGCTKTNLEE